MKFPRLQNRSIRAIKVMEAPRATMPSKVCSTLALCLHTCRAFIWGLHILLFDRIKPA